MTDEEMKNSKDKKCVFPSDASEMGSKEVPQTANCGNKYNYHYAPLFGAICGVLDISQSLTRRMFLRCVVRDIFSSAARLNIMGPLEGASKQREYSTIIENLLGIPRGYEVEATGLKKRYLEPNSVLDILQSAEADNTEQNANKKRKITSIERLQFLEPVTTSPILEILQARHDVLYARLFNS